MKSTSLLILGAALITAGCQSTSYTPPATTVGNVTVTFLESDKFTDVREGFGGSTDQYLLDQLKSHLQTVAAPYLVDGQKLFVNFTDIDLAGDFLPARPGLNDVRIIKDLYIPRMKLTFKLTDADNRTIMEGERNLSDMNFMMNISIVERDQPLFYDKALLKSWVEKEFKK